MSDGSRRFTDREVALVLKRASEIDEHSDARSGAGGGLSLNDLAEIADEVGISREALRQAVSTLDQRLGGGTPWEGAPLVRRAVRAVPVELGEADVAELMRRVDASAEGAGSITEALGSVRWSASDRFVGTQVTVTPRNGQTTIEVAEKTPARLRRVMHFIPAVWGLVGALPFMEATGGGLPTIAVGGLAILLGGVIGRGAFSLLSNRSERRVRTLTAELADVAAAAGGSAREPLSEPNPDLLEPGGS